MSLYFCQEQWKKRAKWWNCGTIVPWLKPCLNVTCHRHCGAWINMQWDHAKCNKRLKSYIILWWHVANQTESSLFCFIFFQNQNSMSVCITDKNWFRSRCNWTRLFVFFLRSTLPTFPQHLLHLLKWLLKPTKMTKMERKWHAHKLLSYSDIVGNTL